MAKTMSQNGMEYIKGYTKDHYDIGSFVIKTGDKEQIQKQAKEKGFISMSSYIRYVFYTDKAKYLREQAAAAASEEERRGLILSAEDMERKAEEERLAKQKKENVKRNTPKKDQDTAEKEG